MKEQTEIIIMLFNSAWLSAESTCGFQIRALYWKSTEDSHENVSVFGPNVKYYMYIKNMILFDFFFFD